MNTSQVKIYNRLGTAPVPQKDFQYWRGTGHRYGIVHETVFSTWPQVEIYNRLDTAPVPQEYLQYQHSAGISTTYHRRGSKRKLGWKLSIGTGAVLEIGIFASTEPTIGPVPTV